MKKICLISLAASLCYPNALKISGTIRDASSGEPLPFANVSLKHESKGASANINGEYELALSPGYYELQVSYIGYNTETTSIELTDKNIQLNVNLTLTGVFLQEIYVHSTSYNNNETVGSTSLQNKELDEISSVFPDVFRSIQTLPGVQVNNEFSAKFNVRGGNYDENLVLVDGTQVYEPFHNKEAENISVSIFNMDLMKKVNLATGGFSAQYGDRLSSVLNIKYREGNRTKYTGSTTLSLTNLNGIFEGPFTSKGSFILGVRKSSVEYIIPLIDFDKYVKPSFYDVQGVITYNLSNLNILQFKFIHAGDDFKFIPGLSIKSPISRKYNSDDQTLINSTVNIREYEEYRAKYYSNLFDLTGTIFISNNFLLNASISNYWQIDRENFLYSKLYQEDFINSIYPEGSLFSYSLYEDKYDNELITKTWEPKISLDLKVNPFYDIKTGFSYININYNQELIDKTTQDIKENYKTFPDTLSDFSSKNFNIFPQNISTNSYKLAGYLENIIQVSDNFIANVGARVDYFDFNRNPTLSPRLSASYKIWNDLNVCAAWGHYYQSPIYRQLAYSTSSDTNTQSQKAEHYVFSLEKNFSFNNGSLTLKAEGYYKKYTDLISTTRNPGERTLYSRKNDSKGYAKGIDIYTTLKLPGYYGWISYGLLFTKEDLLTDSQGEFPRYTDQRHTISIVNDFDLGKKWTLNLRFTYGSGFAYTPYIIQFNDKQNRNEWVQGEKNSEYLPEYKRIDLRISKELDLFNFATNVFLDVSNLLNFKNVFEYKYKYDSNRNPFREEVELWPIIPSLGLTVKF